MAKQQLTPPLNDEAIENKMIDLALRQAESQLKNGTASSQIVTHFLRLATTRAKIELEQLELQNKLLEEKIASERAGQELQEQIGQVIDVLKQYSPPPVQDYDDLY